MTLHHKFNNLITRIFSHGLTGAAIASFLLISSCKKDDTPQLPTLKTETYTSSTLNLTYADELMPGKSVRITVDEADAAKAKMTLFSRFDLSQLSGMGLSGDIAGPGVIPGSPELTIPIVLSPGEGCYNFSGNYTTSDFSFSYYGKIDSEKLTLSIRDGQLAGDIFSGKVFIPAPIKKDGLLDYSSFPFHLVWELDPVAGIDIPLSDLLKLVAAAPIIPVYNNTAYMSIAQAYYNVVKTISLNRDGNIPVIYISTLGGAAHLATTTGNMLQYVPAGQGIKLFVNPLSAVSEILLALSKPQTDAEFVTKSMGENNDGEYFSNLKDDGIDPTIKVALLKSLITTITPQLSDGIPLEVNVTQSGADIYFNTQTSIVFLSNLLKNMMDNPVILTALKEYLASLDLPQLPESDLEAVLSQLPSFLEKTTRLEIGLSMMDKK
ncbi:MAG: DUF4925 domain-containing protein [Muribaculaceae bacterium]|nr:DUF4925 domain-containing protein [Muribaculaceae bacterium]